LKELQTSFKLVEVGLSWAGLTVVIRDAGPASRVAVLKRLLDIIVKLHRERGSEE